MFTFYFLIKNKISNFHERLKDTQLNINNWLIKWLVFFFSNQFDIAHLCHIFLSKEKFASNELRFTQTQKQKWGSVTRMSYTGTGWFKKFSSLKINGNISSTYYCNYRHLNWSFALKIINLELVLSDPVMQPAFVRPSVHCNNSLLTKKKSCTGARLHVLSQTRFQISFLI